MQPRFAYWVPHLDIQFLIGRGGFQRKRWDPFLLPMKLNTMSDPYNRGEYGDPQSQEILRKVKARSFASENNTSGAVTQGQIDLLNAQGEQERRVASQIISELQASGFRFRFCADDLRREPTIWYFDPKHNWRIWRQYPVTPAAQNAIFETYSQVSTQLSASLRNAIESQIRQDASNHTPIRRFNTPTEAVYFSNVVFDWSEGVAREYRYEDHRNSRGTVEFDVKVGADDCEVTLGLVKLMAGGDTDKERLIHAVNVLNIVGIHTLGPTFKSGIFIWACPGGYSGRSTLFKVLQMASGGGLMGLQSLDDLEDRNYVAELEGSTGVFVDERQEVASAKSKWVSTVKAMVGGTWTTKVHKKHEQPRTLEGHWVVNQSLNTLDFIYGADRPLQERVVALTTETIPQSVRDAFRDDPERAKRATSTSEASAYLKWLRTQFGSITEVAAEVDRLKVRYLEDITAVATHDSPTSEFFNEYLTESEDANSEILLNDLQGDLKLWMKRFYPRHAELSIKTVAIRLREEPVFGSFVTKPTRGVNKSKLVLRGFEYDSDKVAADLGVTYMPSNQRRLLRGVTPE